MNYYIDFDGTLYDTAELKKQMLTHIAKTCHNFNKNLRSGDIFLDVSCMFCKEKIYDIFELCQYMAQKYNVKEELLTDGINNLLNNGEQFVFKDSVKFLKKLKEEGHNVFLLTYCAQKNTNFQKQKVAGSKLSEYFDKIYITKEPKYTLDIDYKNGIFIDDNPNDILGLFKTNPIEVIRIKRKANKYSELPLENISVKEVCELNEL